MPRTISTKTGLTGPGQVRFPEEIKEWARTIALTGTAQVYRGGGLDAGGAPTNSWSIHGSAFRARLVPIGNPGGSDQEAGQINEETSHIIFCDPGRDVLLSDRIEMENKMWQVTERPNQTDPILMKIEVKGALT